MLALKNNFSIFQASNGQKMPFVFLRTSSQFDWKVKFTHNVIFSNRSRPTLSFTSLIIEMVQ
jgi:hypothetical protein